jgi:hypothetical protein
MRLYEDQHKYLPPSRTWNEGPSWAWLILPNLEQEPLYRLWDWNIDYFFHVAPRIIEANIPTFFCPSRRDPVSGPVKVFPQRPGCVGAYAVSGALGDYAACIGSTGVDYPMPLPNGGTLEPNGAFIFARGLRLVEFTDGLSQTFLAGEKHVPQHLFGDYPWDCSIFDGHNPVCNTRAAGPNFPLATDRREETWSFGSYHPFLCQFVFADGSVRPMMNVMSSSTLGFMAERNDGHAVSEF